MWAVGGLPLVGSGLGHKTTRGRGKEKNASNLFTSLLCSTHTHAHTSSLSHTRSLAAVALRPQGKRLGRRPRDDLACFPRKKTDQRLTLSAGCTARNMGLRSAALPTGQGSGARLLGAGAAGSPSSLPSQRGSAEKACCCSAAVVGRRWLPLPALGGSTDC